MESWTYSTRSTTVHTTVHCSVGYRTCRPALCASFPPSNVNSSLGTVTRAVGRTNNQLVQSSGTVVAVYPHSYLGCFLSWVLWQARRLSSRAYPQCVELVSITDFLFFCFAASHSERRWKIWPVSDMGLRPEGRLHPSFEASCHAGFDLGRNAYGTV
jgi:hypothetical protein